MNKLLSVRTLLVFGTCVLLAGCVATLPAPDAAHTHPANPHADTSPMPKLETGLLNFTNVVIAGMPAAKPEPQHQHGDKP